MRRHELKTWPSQFAAVLDGRKRHEWRKNDRDFAVGDELVLYEYDPSEADNEPSRGRQIRCRVTWLTEGFGVPDGYCVMTISDVTLQYHCQNCGADDQTMRDADGDLVCAYMRHRTIGDKKQPCGFVFEPASLVNTEANR